MATRTTTATRPRPALPACAPKANPPMGRRMATRASAAPRRIAGRTATSYHAGLTAMAAPSVPIAIAMTGASIVHRATGQEKIVHAMIVQETTAQETTVQEMTVQETTAPVRIGPETIVRGMTGPATTVPVRTAIATTGRVTTGQETTGPVMIARARIAPARSSPARSVL